MLSPVLEGWSLRDEDSCGSCSSLLDGIGDGSEDRAVEVSLAGLLGVRSTNHLGAYKQKDIISDKVIWRMSMNVCIYHMRWPAQRGNCGQQDCKLACETLKPRPLFRVNFARFGGFDSRYLSRPRQKTMLRMEQSTHVPCFPVKPWKMTFVSALTLRFSIVLE